jgi:hypothetical protein
MALVAALPRQELRHEFWNRNLAAHPISSSRKIQPFRSNWFMNGKNCQVLFRKNWIKSVMLRILGSLNVFMS